MSHFRYDVRQKIEAVRRVVEDGRSVAEVAREMGVGEGSVFFWVRRYRQFACAARERAYLPAHAAPRFDLEAARNAAERRMRGNGTQGAGSLVACLRRAGAA